ncbi:hypothetical protein ACQEU3_10820 [Spirillospora sp. CA-253888]
MTDWGEDALIQLRAAAYRGDGRAGAGVLGAQPLGPVLQYAGDVLVAALRQRVPEAERLARKCLEELDGRGRPGDAELAAELTAALGAPRDRGALTEVPADLGALGTALEGDPGEIWVLDLRRGDLLTPDDLEDEPAFDAHAPEYDAQRWLVFGPTGPHPRDMADFAGSVGDGPLRERLVRAVEEGRFADEAGPVAARWRFFKEERQRGRARHWLAEYGYRPGPRTL